MTSSTARATHSFGALQLANSGGRRRTKRS
jgi:hypothetical protein